MSVSGGKQSQLQKPPQTGAGSYAGKQATILLEKGNPGLRRATPDSEALASSDDEADHGMSSSMISNPPVSKPVRRTSWLSEIPSQRRKPSITFGGPTSPAESHPTTPSTDQAGWPTAASPGTLGAGRSHPPSSSFPWGTGIWNEKKEAPARLQEVLPSQTGGMQMNQHHLSDEFSSPPGSRGAMGDSSIPFTIPLHPTPKTYRSQSYSVGQLEQDLQSAGVAPPTGARSIGRSRGGPQYSNLQHRTSRPSILGDLGHDSGVLGRVREDEDDEEESMGQYGGSQQQDRAQPDLRQGRVNHHHQENVGFYPPESSFRNRTMSSTSNTSVFADNHSVISRSSRLYGTGIREADDALDDHEESGEAYGGGPHGSLARRYSEQYPGVESPSGYSQLDNRNSENVRKAHWQTSLGFGSISDLPQSRRHSFADVAPRQGSINAVSAHQQSMMDLSSRLAMAEQHEPTSYYAEDTLQPSRGENRKFSPSPYLLLSIPSSFSCSPPREPLRT